MRTTPAPRVDIRKVLPEFASRAKTTIRLHPRRLAEGETLPLDSSKMGGDFLWPGDEPWGVCPTHRLPLVGVLQLRKTDFPEVEFMPGTDLLQVLWCPQWGHGRYPDPDPAPVVVWRSTGGVLRTLEDIPRPRRLSTAEKRRLVYRDRATRWVASLASGFIGRDLQHQGRMPEFSSESGLPRWFLDLPVQTDAQLEEARSAARQLVAEIEAQQQVPDYADDSLFPLPCRLFPERVTEYPKSSELSKEEEDRLESAMAQALGLSCEQRERLEGLDLYDSELSVADGTKFQGYVPWIQRPEQPQCDHGHLMEHLLTIASAEWDGRSWPRWRAVEDQALYERLWAAQNPEAESLYRPAGLMLGDVGNVYLFVCRRCEGWPTRSILQCS